MSKKAAEDASAPITSARLLLVSDVHAAVKRVAALAAWCRAHLPGASADDDGTGPAWRAEDDGESGIKSGAPFLAGILAAGDLADVPAGEQAVLESVGSGEGDASVVISGLESIICRVVYIPGNHDPISMLDLKSTPQLTSHSTNVHNRALQVLPGLTVLGFGGSVPAYKDGEQVWRGFPYTEEHMEAGLGDLLSPTAAVSGGAGGDDGEAGAGGDGGAVGKGEFAGEVAEFAPHHAGSLPTLGHAATTAHAPPGDDIILMTHVGPQGVATTLDDSKDPGGPPISSGSAALRRALLDPALQERVIANVHGHTHHAPGQAWLGGVRVINPGSLRYGANFCLLSLKRRDEASRWRVVATEFHTLP